MADFERAARLAPNLRDVDYARGRMWLVAGRPELARQSLDRFLTERPDHADALLARSRALVKLGDGRAAVVDLTRTIALLDLPAPEHFLERAQALAAMGADHVEEAMVPAELSHVSGQNGTCQQALV